jgi:predicted negative regulator of RcsB-dependent stress response
MGRKTMQVGVVLALLAMVGFGAWQVYFKKTVTRASLRVQNRTKELVDKNPQLKADWDKAMDDGELSHDEANSILVKGGEKAEPAE